MNFLKAIFVSGLVLAANNSQVAAKSSKSGKSGAQLASSKGGKGTTIVSTQKYTSSGKSGNDVTVGDEGSISKSGKSNTILHNIGTMGKSGKTAVAHEMSMMGMGKSSKTLSLMMDGNKTYLRSKAGKSAKLSKSNNLSMPN